jgi:hypothetical protein
MSFGAFGSKWHDDDDVVVFMDKKSRTLAQLGIVM